MVNGAGSRNKGAAFERLVMGAFRSAGWPAAHRTRTPGAAADMGDIGGLPIVVECKDRRDTSLGAWLAQAELAGERANLPAVVIHKRMGTLEPGRQYVTLSLSTFLWLLRRALPPPDRP